MPNFRKFRCKMMAVACGCVHAFSGQSLAQETFELLDVPDFDQIRVELGGNGACHCLPAATCNWTAFLAQRGFDDLQPGVHSDWSQTTTDPTLDGAITGTIDNFGSLMNTSFPPPSTAGCGTNSKKFKTGIVDIIGRYHDDLNYTIVRVREDFSPRAIDMIRKCASNAVVMPIIGWYQTTTVPIAASADRGLPILERNNGHIVALNGWSISSYCGFRVTVESIQFRDPGDSRFNAAQSMFATVSTDVEEVEAFFRWDDTDFYVRKQDKLADYSSRIALLDGFYALEPAFSISVPDQAPDEVVEVQPQIVMRELVPEQVQALAAEPGEQIVDVAIDPMNSDVYLLQQTLSDVALRRSCRTGEELEALALYEKARHLFFARNMDLLLAAEDDLLRARVMGEQNAVELARVTPPAPIDGLSYDNASDLILTLHGPANVILTWPADLSGPPNVLEMPGGVTLVGPLALAVSPVNGDYFVLDAGVGAVYQLQNVENALVLNSVIEDVSLRNARKVHVAPSGNVWSTSGEEIHEFQNFGVLRGGGWQEVGQSVFQGFRLGVLTVFSSNHSNLDVIHDEETYLDNLLPEEFPGFKSDCPADTNFDGVVNFTDITTILSNWLNDYRPEELTGPGDANDDGVVNFGDITAALSSWLTICP